MSHLAFSVKTSSVKARVALERYIRIKNQRIKLL